MRDLLSNLRQYMTPLMLLLIFFCDKIFLSFGLWHSLLYLYGISTVQSLLHEVLSYILTFNILSQFTPYMHAIL